MNWHHSSADRTYQHRVVIDSHNSFDLSQFCGYNSQEQLSGMWGGRDAALNLCPRNTETPGVLSMASLSSPSTCVNDGTSFNWFLFAPGGASNTPLISP